MGQLDELELGKTLGRVEQKVDSLIISFADYRTKVDVDIATAEKHIENLLAEQNERRGKAIAYGSLSGFAAFVISKIIEHAPSLFKGLLG